MNGNSITDADLTALEEQVSRWRAYSNYRPSGLSWLGEIPSQWESEKIKFNSYVKGRIGWQNLRSSEFTDEGPYLITGMHFANGSVDWESCYHISDERYEVAPQIQIREHDVLITKDGSIGKLAYIDHLPGKASLNSHLLVIRPLRKRYNPRFLYYQLSSSIFQEYIQIKQTGTTFYGITQESIEDFPLVIPSLEEQSQITAFLDHHTAEIDALIAKKQELIERLNEQRTAIISHAVTKGLNPDVPMKDSGAEWLGEIPAHWEVRQVKYLAKVLRGKFTHRPRNDPRLYDGPYPFIQTGDVASAEKYVTEYHQTLNDDGLAVSTEFPSGTLVMTIAANIGDLAILTFPACFPDSIVGFFPIAGVYLDYLYYALRSMRPVMLGTATINTQMNLNVERIGSLFCPYPPKAEQIEISKTLDYKMAEMAELAQKITSTLDKLFEYRAALISAAVTGKIDVRNVYPNVSQ